MAPIDRTQFSFLWSTLHRFAMRKGVPYHDAEDLVSVCITKGLDSFDPARGKLLSLCLVILSNDIVNYWRSRRPTDPLFEELIGDNTDILEAGEEVKAMQVLINQLSGVLTDEEKKFMVTLGEVLEELGHRGVLEAARRLGYDPPVKGHDVLRRIQRKAEALRPPVRSAYQAAPIRQTEEKDLRSRPDADPSVLHSIMDPAFFLILPHFEEPMFKLARAMSRKVGCDRFLGALTERQLTKLASILSLI